MSDSAIDLTTLTEEQQLALQQFTSVTDQDLATAVPLLRKCQWNAQIAITRFFDGDADTVDPVAEAARAPPPQDARRAETLMDSIPARRSAASLRRRSNDLEEAPRVVPTPESQMTQPVPFPLSILLLPFNLTYAIFQRVFGVVGYLFPIIPRLLARFWSGRTSRPSRDTGRKPLNPRDTAARFMREFEEEYGVTHGTVPFHPGGYAQAFDIAKRELKYLLVLLLSPEHDDTAPFVRETLLAPEFIQFVKQHQQQPPPANNLILWAGSVQDAEAYQVATALNVTQFPFLTLISHTPSISSTSMSKLTTSTGPINARDLITKLSTAMQNQNAELERVRNQRDEQQASRTLRREQESAYERSLAQDREKARKKKEEAAAKELAEKEERARAEQKANTARKAAQWRRWRAQRIPSEPTADEKDAVRMSIRLQSGDRIIRRFRADAGLEELYAFVECYDVVVHSEEEGSLSEKEVSEPEAYQHEYKFRLVSPMPREAFDLDKGGSIRERIGRSGNLIVEKVVGEDDDDDDDDDDEGEEDE